MILLGDEYTGLYCTCLWMFLCFKIFSKCVFRLIFKKILFPEEVGTIQMSIDCQEGKEITFHFRLIKDIETYSIWWAPQDQNHALLTIVPLSPQHSTWYIVSVQQTSIKIT